MKPRVRPFKVEVRRATAPSNKSEALAKPALGQPFSRANSPKRLFPELILGDVDPLRRPAAGNEPASSVSSPLPAPTVPVRRVLPDLRPTSVAVGEVSRPSVAPQAKRSTRKSALGRYAAMRAIDDNEKLTSEAAPKPTDPGPFHAIGKFSSPAPAIAPPAPPSGPASKARAEAALRFSRRPKPVTRLPRWERWKERRLPPTCRSKPTWPER
jgi:hypothetical protein